LLGELRRAGYLLGVDWSHKQPAIRDVTILEAAAAKRGRQVKELQEWRRGNGVLWVGELLRADGRTPRRRYSEQLRAASGADEARLRRVLFGPGRSEAGPARRVGPTALEAWSTVRAGDWLWVGSALSRVSSVAGGRVRARDSARCDTEPTNCVDFQPGEVVDLEKNEAPLLVDTAEETKRDCIRWTRTSTRCCQTSRVISTARVMSQSRIPDERTGEAVSQLVTWMGQGTHEASRRAVGTLSRSHRCTRFFRTAASSVTRRARQDMRGSTRTFVTMIKLRTQLHR
jgi:hypothetical protein